MFHIMIPSRKAMRRSRRHSKNNFEGAIGVQKFIHILGREAQFVANPFFAAAACSYFFFFGDVAEMLFSAARVGLSALPAAGW